MAKGKTWNDAEDFVNKQFGPLPKEASGFISSIAQQIISTAQSFTNAIIGVFTGGTPDPPTVQGFDPDPDTPSRHYYEVEVPYFSDTAAGSMWVTIRSDRALTPNEVQEAAEREAADRLTQSPEGFGWDTDDFDALAFNAVTVHGIWKSY